ncbi:uncharacterized protein B0H18DRAFT_1011670 [Fomitopsis serialis]|uniref:uncharacterized protein n=1 Tax=Fomitopsis serialis TaxID=139415 RepID=UPI0020079AF2|nr:uncharacterized protein B0H18DRAFT_1011670 [Neoantrodia serialis]KAH9924548.1 hypothetical protein B0H18DRAFT_1011670 [Neoantrodia serialis]
MGSDNMPGSVNIAQPRSHCTGGRSLHRRTNINDLPCDILIFILCDVFQETPRFLCPQGASDWDDMKPGPRAPYDDRSPERASAEYLASVCPLWREAMSNISTFWTQIIIWTGRDSTPLSRIYQYLTWSRNQLLDIFIMRRFDPSVDDRMEKAQVQAIVGLLLPHVGRWRTLCARVLHASSLPIPRIDLVGHAGNLVKLHLDFLVDDAVANTTAASLIAYHFDTPVLESLAMGGSPMPPTLQAARTDFDNLQLHSSGYAGPAFLPRGWDVEISFIDMCGDVIEAYTRLLDYPYVESVAYSRCTFPPRNISELGPVGASYIVSLDEIADPTALFYFLTTVAGSVSCTQAYIDDCDGLQANVLRQLGAPVPTEHEDEGWLCPYLKELHINGCKHFSSADLRAMVEARYRAHEETGFAEEHDDEYVVRSVLELYVYDCCELAPEDREWFSKHVEIVHWDGWMGET